MGAILALGLAAGVLGVWGCAKVPIVGGASKAKIELRAMPNCNSCGKDQGYPLTFRVVQLTDASPLAGVTLVQLWDHEDKLLGGVFVSKSTNDVIEPGSKKELSVELDDKTRAVVLVGNFCKTSGSCWYHVGTRKGGGGVTMRLLADASCLKVTRR
jgi:type VI secretion system VasD/TssJ family lipoprotein